MAYARFSLGIALLAVAIGCSAGSSPTAPTPSPDQRGTSLQTQLAIASTDTSVLAMERLLSLAFDAPSSRRTAVTLLQRSD